MTNAEPNQPETGSTLRLRILKIAAIVFFTVIVLRLIQVQIIDAAKYAEIAEGQYKAKLSLPATRGSICDRNGALIASNSLFVSFAADPMLATEEARTIATTFSKVFGRPKSVYL